MTGGGGIAKVALAQPGTDDDHTAGLADLLCVFEHDCLVPIVADRLTERRSLLQRVVAVPPPGLVLVTAPAGSGKTVLLTQIAAADERDAVWVTVQPRTAAPMRLLQHIAVALDRIEPLRHGAVASLVAADASWASAALPRLLTAMRRRRPFVLFVDDAHHLVLPESIECLEHLAAGMPEHSTLVVASRHELKLRLGPVHRYRHVLRVDAHDLAFSAPDVAALGREIGVVVSASRAQRVVERTEGWAAAVSVALWAMRDEPEHRGRDTEDALVDSSVLAFVEQEYVERLPTDLRRLLERTSILDRVTGPLADAVAGSDEGGTLLRRAATDASLFVVAIEGRSTWYRFHPVLQHILQHRLIEEEADCVPELHRRATTWFEAHGDLDRAIVHARLAGALQHAADLVFADAFDLATTGHTDTLGQRLAVFTDEQLEDQGALCLAQALYCMSTNRPDEVEEWIARAVSAPADQPLSDGTPSVAAGAACLRAMVAAEPGDDLLTIIGWPGQIDPTRSSLSAAAVVLTATLQWMKGNEATATALLRDAEAGWVRNPTLQVMALAYLALLRAEAGDPDEAAQFELRARSLLRTGHVTQSPIAANPLLALAVLDARAGRAHEAARLALAARRLLAMFGHLAPRSRLLAFLLLAEVHLCLGELDGTRANLAEARPLLAREHWAEGLHARHDRLQETLAERLHVADALHEPGPASLTPAELRVLAYLPTHLSLREIGERLYRSSHTIKSQTVSTYRKLGVNTRSEAVQRARDLGLIE